MDRPGSSRSRHFRSDSGGKETAPAARTRRRVPRPGRSARARQVEGGRGLERELRESGGGGGGGVGQKGVVEEGA